MYLTTELQAVEELDMESEREKLQVLSLISWKERLPFLRWSRFWRKF